MRLAAAAASGLLLFLGFPPVGASWAVFVALVPLFWAAFSPAAPDEPSLTFRRQFLLGFVCAVTFFVSCLHWILFLSNQEVTIPGLMVPSLLFMSAYLGVFFGAAVGLAGLTERAGGLPAAFALPVFWTLFDALRSLGVLGFPWGSAGYALARHPIALQFTAWTGFWGLTFWIVMVNGLASLALFRWQQGNTRGAAGLLGAAAVLVVLPLALGAAILHQAPSIARDTRDGMKMALIQANTPREIKWRQGFEGIVVSDLLARTEKASALDPDLIVWPETAAPVLMLWDPELAAQVRETVARLRRFVLVGTLDAALRPGGGADSYNAAVLYNPEGVPAQRYYKTHLVPFSEAMPFQDKIPWINALNFGQSDFSSGREKDLFTIGEWRFSVLICFESIFPDLSRRLVRDGAQYLVNTTNDFWFGRSAGPVQHAEMAIHRAVENRTPLARCANTGFSFFVDPWGRVFDRTELFVEAMPVARQAPGRGGSFYTRHGEWLSWALLAVGVLSILQTARAGRINRAGARNEEERAT